MLIFVLYLAIAGSGYAQEKTPPRLASENSTVTLYATADAWIDAADHLGAVAGAILTAVILLPALGFTGTILTLAGLKIVGLWICLAKKKSF